MATANGIAAERPAGDRRRFVEAARGPAVGLELLDVDVRSDRSRDSRSDRPAVADAAATRASSRPFSAIRQWPPKTRSVVDSVGPAPA